jgi:hypothetical protein
MAIADEDCGPNRQAEVYATGYDVATHDKRSFLKIPGVKVLGW